MTIVSFEIIKQVYKNDGVRGFYRGLKANLIGVCPEKAIKLTINDMARSWFAKTYEIPLASQSLPMWMGALSGGIAGFCQVIATNPMEMVKINMQILSKEDMKSPPTTWQLIKRLKLNGLYRGTLATLSRYVQLNSLGFHSIEMFLFQWFCFNLLHLFLKVALRSRAFCSRAY
jgi:hypothetical protein